MNYSSRHRKKPIVRSEDEPMSLTLDRVRNMRNQEQTKYKYQRYSTVTPPYFPEEFLDWRDKICNWNFSVIDHYGFNRKTVAISMDLFDRFMATRGNTCDGNQAFLTSLATLYIAIKLHERKKISLSTITQLSKGQFEAKDVERMELEILHTLTWCVHPPTTVEFIMFFLEFLPPEIPEPAKQDIFELTQYLSELAVCDHHFIEHDSSTIAFASILNVLEFEVSYSVVSGSTRERFMRDLQTHLSLQRGKSAVRTVRNMLREKLKAIYGYDGSSKENSQKSSRSKRAENSRDEFTRSSSDSTESWNSRSGSSRLRCDSLELASDASKGSSKCSKVSKGSRGSKGSKGSRSRGKFRRARTGSLVAPC